MRCPMSMLRAGLAAVVILAVVPGRAATVSPARIFADHVVLQRRMPVPVWGTAVAGSEVEVTFAGQSVSARTAADGRWRVTLRPLEASDEGRDLTVACGAERVTIRDVVVGEVWFVGGQSNMQYTAGEMAGRLPAGAAVVTKADMPAIRLLRIGDPPAAAARPDLAAARWDVCSPATVVGHSAVGFVLARRLHVALRVPVGIIDGSVGGTPIEPHVPEAAFVGHPTLERIAALARAGDVAGIRALPGGTLVRGDHWLPGRLFNGRIAPVAPHAIRGVAWYQGESNCGQGEDPRDYEAKLRALVAGWRAAWSRPDLPFVVVQLPRWRGCAWPHLREEQRRAVAGLERAGLVVTIDLDHADDIHPPNKIDVGERLARWPLAWFHGHDLPVQGPVFRAAEARAGVMIVDFDHAEDGLMAGRQTAPGEPVIDSGSDVVNGCELCDERGGWHAATARIDGPRLVVTSPMVTRPVAVRYACLPEPPRDRPWNLHRRSGLPAGPFCSDFSRMPYLPERNRP